MKEHFDNILEKSLYNIELLKKSGQLSVKMNLKRFLIIEFLILMCVRGIILSYLNDMFIALHLITTFEIRPGCYTSIEIKKDWQYQCVQKGVIWVVPQRWSC